VLFLSPLGSTGWWTRRSYNDWWRWAYASENDSEISSWGKRKRGHGLSDYSFDNGYFVVDQAARFIGSWRVIAGSDIEVQI